MKWVKFFKKKQWMVLSTLREVGQKVANVSAIKNTCFYPYLAFYWRMMRRRQYCCLDNFSQKLKDNDRHFCKEARFLLPRCAITLQGQVGSSSIEGSLLLPNKGQKIPLSIRTNSSNSRFSMYAEGHIEWKKWREPIRAPPSAKIGLLMIQASFVNIF